VTSTIIGATSLEQLGENIGAYKKIDQISGDVMADIEAVYKRFRDPSRL
jgi:aryl-alcohol dehydrogenase-like predicted oxidoreductase